MQMAYAASNGAITAAMRHLAAEVGRAGAARDERSLDDRVDDAGTMAPSRGFAAALAGGATLPVISEIKRRSPSKGDLFPDLVAAELARTYESGGASCLSVLTDLEFS